MWLATKTALLLTEILESQVIFTKGSKGIGYGK
jgi:hypothetical protein